MSDAEAGVKFVRLRDYLAGEDPVADVLKTETQAEYKMMFASGLVAEGRGRVFGIIVSTHTGGQVKLWDNTAAAGSNITNFYPFSSGSGIYKFPAAIKFTTGLYIEVSGTAAITVIYKED